MNARRTGRRLVIFDVDGTLVDSQDHIVAAMARAFAAEAVPLPPRAAILDIVGLSLPEAMARLVPGLDAPRRAALVAAYKTSFSTGPDAKDVAPLFPGIRVLLDQLVARGPELVLGVATGKSRRGLDRLIAGHALQDMFITLQTADGHPSKPDPAMILAALAETGTDPRDAVMIGDTSYDIAMGRAAGVATIGVEWGYHRPGVLTGAGATAMVARAEAIPGALEWIWGQR